MNEKNDSTSLSSAEEGKSNGISDELSVSPEDNLLQIDVRKKQRQTESELTINQSEASNCKPYLCISVFALLYIAWGINTSIMGPFFPTEAQKTRNISQSMVGMITSVLMVTLWLFSIVFFFVASDKNKHSVFYVGVFTSSVMCVAFGESYRFDNPTSFIMSCLATRLAIGFAGACLWSTGAPILIPMMPKKAGKIFSLLEFSAGFGFMIGPPLGSLLFSFGGYKLPFLVAGLLELFIGFLCVAAIRKLVVIRDYQHAIHNLPKSVSALSMPSLKSVGLSKDAKFIPKAAFKFLTHPGILLTSLPALAVLSQFGFFQVALAPHLEDTFGIHGDSSGKIFLIHAGLSALTCAVYGVLIDRGHAQFTFITCAFLTALGYFVLGLPLIASDVNPKITLFTALTLLGLTANGGYLPCYFIFERFAVNDRIEAPHKLRIYVCTWVNTCYSFGLISGQFFVGGLFFQRYSFYHSCMLLALITLTSSLLICAYLILPRKTTTENNRTQNPEYASECSGRFGEDQGKLTNDV